MAELKPGWKRVRFGDVVRQVKDKVDPHSSGLKRYVAGEHMDTDDLRIRRWGDVGDGYLGPAFHMHFKPGQVLYGSRRTYLRKVAVAVFEGICANTTFVLESADSSKLLPELLPFIMQTEAFHEHSKRESKGSVNPYVNFSDLAWYEFALPPLEEQARIANALQQASGLTEALRSAVATAEVARSSLIVKLYRHGTSGEPMKLTSIGMVPRSWTVEPLGNRFTIQLGKMISKEAVTGVCDGEQTPYLRNANVQWNHLDLKDVSTMAFTAQEKEKFSLRPGDILACEGRHVGKSAIWRNEIPGACYQKALHRLRAKGEDLPEYLLYCLFFCSITGRFSAITGETTIPHLPAEKLRAIEVAFPPLEEQVDIVRRIASFDASLATLASRLSRASLLVKSFGLELS